MKAFAFMSCVLAAGSAAAAMKDPTQPPAAVLSEAPAGESPRAAPPPLLQSVIIAKGNRAAIIDGERVELGGRFRDAVVVKIAEDEVVLRQDGATQVLKLYPDIEKKTVKAPESASSRPPVRSRLP